MGMHSLSIAICPVLTREFHASAHSQRFGDSQIL